MFCANQFTSNRKQGKELRKPITPHKPSEPAKEHTEWKEGSFSDTISDDCVLNLADLQSHLRDGVPKDIPNDVVCLMIEVDKQWNYDDYTTTVRIFNKYKQTSSNPKYEKEYKRYLKEMERYEEEMVKYRETMKEYNVWEKEEQKRLKEREIKQLETRYKKLTKKNIQEALDKSAKGAQELHAELEKSALSASHDLKLDSSSLLAIIQRASNEVNSWPDWKRSPDIKAELLRHKLAQSTSDDKILSKEELRARVEAFAQKTLGVSAKKAYKMLDAGKLDGTIAEVELKSFRMLLQGSKNTKK